MSTNWVVSNLDRLDMRIIDMRNNIVNYWQGHISKAVYIHPEVMRLADHGVPVKLMPPQAFSKILGAVGIDPNTLVVVYTEKGDFKGPYLIWVLDYLGHKRAAVMEGGFAKWQKKDLPITQDYPKIAPKKYPLPKRLRYEVCATLGEVKRAVNLGSALILDVRPLA
ncbi:MAG: sulfurtransferase [Thermodesulfobacteriota bacterium]